MELRTGRRIQAEDQGIVGRGPFSSCLCERDAGGGEDLQGAHDSADVAGLDALRRLGVNVLEAAMQGCVALTLGEGCQLSPKVGLGRCWGRLPAFEQSPCVLARASDEEG